MIRFKSKRVTSWVKGGVQNHKVTKSSGSDPDITISEFESPKKSQQNSEYSITTLTDESDSVTRKRPRERKSLVKQIKQTMAIYGSSVKSLSTYGCKNSSANDSSLMMRLVVLKCLFENVATWTLSLDLDCKRYKWIIFKPRKSTDILPGICIKLFHPWQQIFVPSLNEEVIICTDFYSRCEPTEIGINEIVVKEELDSTRLIMKWKSFNAVSVDATKLFTNILPYAVSNAKTVTKQLSFYKSSIDLDIVICQIWKTPESIFALVKDSDKFISALGIATENEDLCNVCSAGTFISFKNLNVREKVTTWSYMPLFSVISLHGSRQNFCYQLGIGPDTAWNIQMLLDIPFHPKDPPNKTLWEVSKMGGEDCRFNMRANIKYLNSNQIVIWDDSTCLKGKVEIIPAYKNQFLLSANTIELEEIELKYVRYFRGKLSMDKFSAMQFSSDRRSGQSNSLSFDS